MRDWLVEACRQADFTPRILQDADREPAVIKFVAAKLGVALLPQQIQMLPHEGVVFRPLKPALITESCAVWRPDNRSNCLEHYVRIVKELLEPELAASQEARKPWDPKLLLSATGTIPIVASTFVRFLVGDLSEPE